MKTIKRLIKIISHPRVTSREILQENKIYSSLAVVLGSAVLLSILFLISHLKGDYPPPPEELKIWIDTWGEFSMLPFVGIPAEIYRLAQAIFIIPLMIAIWILMAGSAKIFSILFDGKVTFLQYLNLFGFSFFTFWILGNISEMIYSGVLGDYVLNALRMEYGQITKTIIAYYPPVVWTAVLSLGGIYNGIVTHESEHFVFWQVLLVAATTFVWPIILISVLIR